MGLIEGQISIEFVISKLSLLAESDWKAEATTDQNSRVLLRVHIFKGQPELATCNQPVNQQYALSNGFAIVYQQAISST